MSKISLNSSAITRILGVVACFLILASIGGQFARFALGYPTLKGVVPLFFVDTEQNIPTFFSVLLLLFSALLLVVITIINKKQRTPHLSKWVTLSFGFLYLAYDEAFQVHEQLIEPIRMLLGSHNLGIFYFSWVIPGIILVLFLALFFLRFLLDLPSKTRLQFLMATTFYIGGAIGLELIGGRYADLNGVENLIYSMIVTIEESLEMTGIIVFIWALLKYCEDNCKAVLFQFGSNREFISVK